MHNDLKQTHQTIEDNWDFVTNFIFVPISKDNCKNVFGGIGHFTTKEAWLIFIFSTAREKSI